MEIGMEQIKYKSGEFRTFTATRSFELGAFNIRVAKGGEVEFDGSIVRYGGMTYTFPQLRGAYSSGWMVLADEYNENDPSYGRPVPANMQMRPAVDNGKPQPKTIAITTETDERVVLNTAEHAANTRAQNKQGARTASTAVESQDGVPVRTLKTLAGSKAMDARTVLTSESAGEALRAAENVRIDPGKGVTQDEMLERMPEADREVYLAEKASLRSRYVDTDAPAPETVAVVKTAKTKAAEGMTLTQSVGGGVEVADFAGTSKGKAKASTLTEDGITFKNTNGPEQLKPQVHPRSMQASVGMDGMADARLRVAKALCPEFPDTYNFSAPPKKKLARLQADFEDRPDVLRAVFAAESDEFKVLLVEEFPQAFQG